MADHHRRARLPLALALLIVGCSEPPPETPRARREHHVPPGVFESEDAPATGLEHRHGIRAFSVGVQYGREGEGDYVSVRADGCFQRLESAGMAGRRRCDACTSEDLDGLFERVAALVSTEPRGDGPRPHTPYLDVATLDGTQAFHGDAFQPILERAVALVERATDRERGCQSRGPAFQPPNPVRDP